MHLPFKQDLMWARYPPAPLLFMKGCKMGKREDMEAALLRRLKKDVTTKWRTMMKLLQNERVGWDKVQEAMNEWKESLVLLMNVTGDYNLNAGRWSESV